ncbi:Cu(I)/Ag(I) efflux system membrane protein CusA/SilA [Allofrancisella inopinata]|uniref:efflux RND transporter permease subunit n=1 Tax=Allofrancisella inopinata TaxID=1085647 RepID=UPI001063BB24|nr:CusA/CzcA family heavy metal efflux RND transporter [Allofrancisella inopinata]TDT66930.1 Cu(I)/Ag(I) efflux system membrane protein CusA/SilA [Allofrancisella inopinata]
MITKVVNWSIKNRFLVLVAMFFLLSAGIYSVKNTPVDAIPDLSDVQVIVKTSYPGQAPQVVEDQITYPLSSALLTVPGAQTVRGYSFFGDSYVYIIFNENTDMYWARSRVLEVLNQISSELPKSAKMSLGPDATGVGWIYEYALIDTSHTLDISKLTSLQNWFLKYELQTIPGVSEVATVGGMVKQYQIELNLNAMRAYKLSIKQIKTAITNSNQEVGGSVIELAEAEYMVRTNGYLKDIKSIENIPVGIENNGTPVLLKNVATIEIGPEMRRGVVDLNGQGDTVGGIIIMRTGENALKTINAVKDKLKSLKSSLPDGVKIIETYDRSSLINNAIDNLSSKLVEEFLIVLLVCLVFLFHIRSSLVILISLPIGILCAFIIMRLQGINANIMSLGGIAIAIGAMVDAAIVMIENLHKHFEKNEVTKENRWNIIASATSEVGPPIFFSLLIITLSFMPVFALQAQEGKLFSPLVYTKTYAMAVSAGLSITLVPVLMGYLVRGRIVPEHKNPINKLLIVIYKPILAKILKYSKTTILISIIIIFITIYPIKKIGNEFMPEMNEGDLMYMPTLMPGVSIGKARQILQQTDRLIKSVPEVKTVFGKIGRAQTATDPAPLTMIETIIQFKPKSEWRKGMTFNKIKEILNSTVKLPGVTNAWVMPIRTRIDMLATGIKTPIGIKISGSNLTKLQDVGTSIANLLKKIPSTSSVYADKAEGGRYINVDIDRVKAANYGLSIADIQSLVSIAIGGINISESIEGLERYPINLRFPQYERDSIEKLKLLPIITPIGAEIPLDDVAKVYIDNGPPIIKSENSRLTSLVLVDVDSNVDIGNYISQVKSEFKKNLKLPTGYSITFSGQYEYMQRANQQLLKVIPFTIIIIVLLLYMSLNNIFDVLIIVLTLPLAIVGGIWLTYLLGYSFSVAVGVGFIALAGVAIEINVLMLVYIKQSLKNNQLTKLHYIDSAIINGATSRVRAITMTVVAVISGLIPIILSSGAGSEVMKRIATPMVGGMLSTLILSLILLPALYYQYLLINWKLKGDKK